MKLSLRHAIRRNHRTVVKALLLSTFAFLSVACGGAEDPGHSTEGLGGASNGSNFPAFDETCESGTLTECTINIKQSNGIISCFDGFRYCVDERWTGCRDPDLEPPF